MASPVIDSPSSSGTSDAQRRGVVIDVVVPARDHETSLRQLLADLPHRELRSVVVVDRASRDRSAEIARDAGALVLREPSGGYGAACARAQAHFQALPRVPEVVVFLPGDRPAAASSILSLVAPIVERGVELVLGVQQSRRSVGEKLATTLIDTVYGRRWAGIGPVRALEFPALVALGMRDRGDGWDVEMLVRATKLGLSCDEVALPGGAHHDARLGSRALLHILRHATMR
ncbi:MAG TPA: glycosyltransferase [Kofleriaceae bacterium]|jgi:glycosyltransferase involved in cell wall biosynthesis